MKQVLKVYLRLVIALLPVVFLPLMIDSLATGKNWIVVVLAGLGLLIWVVGLVVSRNEAKVRWNGIMSWVLLLVLWSTVSFAMEKAGVRGRSGVGLFGWGTILASGVLSFLWLQVSDKEEREKQLWWLTVSGLVVALMSLIIFLIPNGKLPINIPKENPLITISAGWSVTSSVISELWLMVILAWFWVEKLWKKLKNKENYLVEAIISGLLTLIVFLDVFKTIKSGWGYLDLGSSWMIAVESLKQEPFFGVGIGNFVEAFSKWRPVTFNLTPSWATLFGWSGSWLLHIWTELGIVGLLVMIFTWWKGWKNQSEVGEKIKIVILGAVLLLSPVAIVGWFLWLWVVFGSENSKSSETKAVLRFGDENGMNIGPALMLVLVLAGLGWGGFWWTKILVGEIYVRNSLVAAAKNDGLGMYNWQVKAVAMNPNNAEYRRLYSQTNMTLAINMLTAKDLSDEDKEKGVVLTQQAVREAKAAVTLDENNPSFWSNLATIYKQLIGSVDGAADWSLQAYYQATVLDPVNPLTRFDMGSLFFALNGFEEADRSFEQSVTLKQDYANAWYNWAHTAKKLNKLSEAVTRLNQAMTLVDAGTADYDNAVKELATWKKELDDLTKQQQKQQEKQPETLKLPEALPTPNQEVDVPTDGLEPPAVEPTPTGTE